MDTAIELAMGALFRVLTSGVVFVIFRFVWRVVGGGWLPGSTVALCVTGIFLIVSLVAAWRQVNPFAGLKPMSDADHLAFAASQMV
jgi:hypothetical protein